MTSAEKQSELIRHQAIIQAALDYLIQFEGGRFVLDDCDFAVEYYQQQKIQAEKYFKLRRLDRLQQQLTRFVEGRQIKADMVFSGYIKENTGYELDIFEDLRKHFQTILERGEIRDHKEHSDVMVMLQYHEQTAGSKEIKERIGHLLSNYAKRMFETGNRKQTGYSEVISRVEENGLITEHIRFSTGPKPKHLVDNEVISPDGKRSLHVVQWSNGTNASTYVSINLEGGSGAIYSLDGIFPDVKACWSDNQTIVIETEKDHRANTQCRRVQSFDDVIRIKYVIAPPAI